MTEPLVAASATTTAETTTAETTTQDTTTTAPVWTDGLPQETLGFVEKKGWKGNADVITSYQNLEKLNRFIGGALRFLRFALAYGLGIIIPVRCQSFRLFCR